MADAVKKVTVLTQQDDFNVSAAVALAKLMDPAEVQEGDQWAFYDGGSGSNLLVITRKRIQTIEYPDPEPDPPPEPEPAPGEPVL